MHTYEAVYESGVVRLPDAVRLPEHTKVYVLVPDAVEKPGYGIVSPHLADPQQVADFAKEVIEEGADGRI